MRVWGSVGFVDTATRGSEVDIAATAGATTLHVADVSDFINYGETRGGMVDVGETGTPFAYTEFALDAVGPGGTLTLAAALAADAYAGIRVDLWAGDHPVTDFTVDVILDDGTPVRATNSDHIGELKLGPRDSGSQELVSLVWDETDWAWYVDGVHQQVPQLYVYDTIQLTSGASLRDASAGVLIDSSDAGLFPSTMTSLDTRVTILEGEIGPSGGSGGGISIDCGSAAAAGVSIDCGGA